MALGDAHVDLAARNIFGPLGSKIIMTFVVISIIGTINGLIMGHIRLPYSLGIRGMLPKAKEISKINKFTGISINSAIIAFIASCVCLFLHYITQKYSLIPNGDISEISITVNYMLYVLLYYKVFRMGITGEVKGLWRGKINPIFATIGSLIILFGSFNNPMFKYYLLVNCLLLTTAYLFCKYRKEEI